MPPIVHIVMFEFTPNLDASSILTICSNMLSLKEKCVHPETKQTYIKTAMGGKDNSPEEHQGGFTHAFISHFDNEADREYYLNHDPAHLEFVKSLDGKVKSVKVVDFTPGVL